MSKKIPYQITFNEGTQHSLLLQLKDTFGGTLHNKHHYTVNNEWVEGFVWYFSLQKGLEVTLNSLKFKNDHQMITLGETKETARICFRFEHIGAVMQGKKTKLGKDLGLTGNMIAYDTRLDFLVDIKKDTLNQWLAVRVDQEAVKYEHVSFTKYFGDVFNQSSLWWRTEIVPLEVQVQLKDAFGMSREMHVPVFNNRLVARGSDCVSIFYDKLLSRNQIKEHSLHEQDFTYMMDLKNKLLQSLERPPSLESLSEEYGFSVSKLRRDFEQVFGTSIHRFHYNFRLEKAKSMLATENKSILEISRSCGFKSSTKFTEAFKKKFGVTPKMISQRYQHLY
ncbi:helix-turn-helix transcriptional regulator [Flammeovirga sp. MY04]|uniref:helix-turn-helix transcriptional regulator n=1 Tax=Flammeovirga sp. MY04 TaxID=1191459 RepID=UPI0008063C75|nr:AraC family transcriptional regulator [Flammeovirga sp. MY04]ANQ51114.1 helix-turn-helix transcriptional regulator [Flammeovirga sp. MY04]